MKDITDAEFKRIREYIKLHYGINLGDEKKSLIYSRLRATLVNGGFESFSEYFDYLLQDKSGNSIINFVDKITTNHTFFMREADHFDFFKDTVLPYIEETYASKKEICLWCAASSTGEESVTLQMILTDYFEGKNWNTEILATDISSNVLDRAVLGVYPRDKVETLPKPWQKKYFDKYDDDNMQVTDQIKKNITYRKFNLMQPSYTFRKKMHVIFVRNVMIYFDNVTRDQCVQKFYDATDDGGYLFIGHSESLTHTSTNYKYVKPAVYRKTK